MFQSMCCCGGKFICFLGGGIRVSQLCFSVYGAAEEIYICFCGVGIRVIPLWFSVCAAVEENLYLSGEEISVLLSYVSVYVLLRRNFFLRRRYRSYLEEDRFFSFFLHLVR